MVSTVSVLYCIVLCALPWNSDREFPRVTWRHKLETYFCTCDILMHVTIFWSCFLWCCCISYLPIMVKIHRSLAFPPVQLAKASLAEIRSSMLSFANEIQSKGAVDPTPSQAVQVWDPDGSHLVHSQIIQCCSRDQGDVMRFMSGFQSVFSARCVCMPVRISISVGDVTHGACDPQLQRVEQYFNVRFWLLCRSNHYIMS